MSQLITIVLLGLGYYLGRFHSEWVYAISGMDMAKDTDRIVGLMVTLAIVVVVWLALAVLLGRGAASTAHTDDVSGKSSQVR
ncbi:hypothetical protein ACNFIA_16755 [Pseudomonas sp. NY15437]|uniref:hypothetical protein n=1 Tax=Pseudomonas sp. NY15437 TaxID=3400360 RepID=UPI003A8664A3